MGEKFYNAALIAILIPYGLTIAVLLWNEIGPAIRMRFSWRERSPPQHNRRTTGPS